MGGIMATHSKTSGNGRLEALQKLFQKFLLSSAQSHPNFSLS